MKYELGGKIIKEFLGLRAKSYSFLIEATQLEDKINHRQKNEIDPDSLTKEFKEFLKNN